MIIMDMALVNHIDKKTPLEAANLSPFLAFLILIVSSLPLFMLANRPSSWMMPHSMSFILGIVWLTAYLRGYVTLSRAFIKAVPVLIVFLVVAFWILAQIHFLPEGYGSQDKKSGYFEFLKTVSYVTIFCGCLLIVRTKAQLTVLAWTILLMGAVQASILFVTGSSGTFVNRNHLAGYLEMSIACGIGLMVFYLDSQQSKTWRGRVRFWIDTLLGPRVIVRIIIVFLVVALIQTQSRMGNVAFLGGLSVAAIVGYFAYRNSSRIIPYFFLSVLFIDIVLVGSFLGIDRLRQRFEQLDQNNDLRIVQFQQAGQMVLDYWATGIGAGSYYAVYPFYRDERVPFYYDHAHNDYFEFLIELGLVVFTFLAMAVILAFILAIRVQFERTSSLQKAMGLVATMGIASILFHSLGDFNLHINANAGTFMIFLALPFIAQTIEHRNKK